MCENRDPKTTLIKEGGDRGDMAQSKRPRVDSQNHVLIAQDSDHLCAEPGLSLSHRHQVQLPFFPITPMFLVRTRKRVEKWDSSTSPCGQKTQSQEGPLFGVCQVLVEGHSWVRSTCLVLDRWGVLREALGMNRAALVYNKVRPNLLMKLPNAVLINGVQIVPQLCGHSGTEG